MRLRLLTLVEPNTSSLVEGNNIGFDNVSSVLTDKKYPQMRGGL